MHTETQTHRQTDRQNKNVEEKKLGQLVGIWVFIFMGKGFRMILVFKELSIKIIFKLKYFINFGPISGQFSLFMILRGVR